MLDLEKLHSLAVLTVDRVIRDYPERDKILIDIEEIITEAVRQHARVMKTSIEALEYCLEFFSVQSYVSNVESKGKALCEKALNK